MPACLRLRAGPGEYLAVVERCAGQGDVEGAPQVRGNTVAGAPAGRRCLWAQGAFGPLGSMAPPGGSFLRFCGVQSAGMCGPFLLCPCFYSTEGVSHPAPPLKNPLHGILLHREHMVSKLWAQMSNFPFAMGVLIMSDLEVVTSVDREKDCKSLVSRYNSDFPPIFAMDILRHKA